MFSSEQEVMTPGISPLSSFLFFYIFFLVLLIFLMYGLWEVHQGQIEEQPNPLSVDILGVPESVSLFDEVQITLRVENCGKKVLKNIHVECGNNWVFSLKPGDHHDISLNLDTRSAGIHELRARIYCKKWELHACCYYRVLQKFISRKEKYLKVLGLKSGANKEEIKKARNRLAKMYHPDLESGYEEKMKEINEAYHYLMDS